jgi:hypothetical protein
MGADRDHITHVALLTIVVLEILYWRAHMRRLFLLILIAVLEQATHHQLPPASAPALPTDTVIRRGDR